MRTPKKSFKRRYAVERSLGIEKGRSRFAIKTPLELAIALSATMLLAVPSMCGESDAVSSDATDTMLMASRERLSTRIRPRLEPSEYDQLAQKPLLTSRPDSEISVNESFFNIDDALAALDELEAPVPETPAEMLRKEPPDVEELRRLITTDHYALGSLSIGAPDAGALFNGHTLANGPLWHVRDPHDAWATEETLAFVAAAIQAVESRHPGSPSLLIGDLSRRQGGPIDRHRSHQSGRDVDLGWYLREDASSELHKGDVRRLDLPRCWTLVRALVTETDVERIFIDRSIQRALFRHALESGEDRAWLETLFEGPGGRRDMLIRHARGHTSHLHARFFNRRAQEWGRIAYPLLIEAGLAPPPVVLHRARRGDTLSTIARRYRTSVAAVRRANGLRSSRIRAGRTYRIPTRFTAAVGEPPVVVPPRRLPPAPIIVADSASE